MLCLDPMVVRISQRIRADLYAENVDMGNRGLRHGAYRQFTYWRHGKLGSNVRRVIPSCCILRIRNAFPSVDGRYTGFKESVFV